MDERRRQHPLDSVAECRLELGVAGEAQVVGEADEARRLYAVPLAGPGAVPAGLPGTSGFLNAAPGAERINRQPSSGLAVGAVVALAIWFAGPTSGASMNPARSLAPALFAGEPLQYLWIYVIGPVGGALLAGLVGRLIRHSSRSRS